MHKTITTFAVLKNNRLSSNYSQLILKPELNDEDAVKLLKSFRPGQFVQVKVDTSKTTFLRRPISVNFVDLQSSTLHLLIRNAGDGTKSLCELKESESVNIIAPLGKGFSLESSGERPLLVGGGVGVAPLLYLGKILSERSIRVTFLLAAKTAADLLLLNEFKEYGNVVISTDDGSKGHRGLVTENPALRENWDMIYCCGPMPMMKGIATLSREANIACEVSLENSMACGLGACLCCVEDTIDGHVCVCTEGPVFNVNMLKW